MNLELVKGACLRHRTPLYSKASGEGCRWRREQAQPGFLQGWPSVGSRGPLHWPVFRAVVGGHHLDVLELELDVSASLINRAGQMWGAGNVHAHTHTHSK